MKAAAAKEKIYFDLESAYRTYEHQRRLRKDYEEGRGAYAAEPGDSDHGLGKAIDLYPEAAQNWVRAKGRQYGWYWPPETGEPWHFVYVGGGRLEPKQQQVQVPKQQLQIPDAQNYGVKEGEQKRIKYQNKDYVIARDKNMWRVYKVNPTTGMLEEINRTDQIFPKIIEEYRKTQSPTSPKPQQPVGQAKKSGKASYYADAFQGRRTANGEIFDMNKLTAASPTLPFGTMVNVTNKANGKSVRVRINDRGPYEPDLVTPSRTRIIDLSKAAMDKLGGLRSGVIDVDLSYQGGGYVPRQSPRRDTQSLSSYPSYSAGGGMTIAIQPMIIERPVPVPSGKNKSIMFPIPAGVNNSNMQSLSRG
jgi:rare lipoprotein A